jgi:hypothetical protein
MLFLSHLFRFILESEVHWRESKICVSENDSRRATNSFAISVFLSVCPAVEPHGKPGLLNCYGGRSGGGGVVGCMMKMCRPVDIRYNRTKLTVSVREKVRKILYIYILYI